MPGISNFPAALDTFPEIEPNSPEDGDGLEHDNVHQNVHAAIAALQVAMGITGSADINSLAYKLAALSLFSTNENVQDIVGSFLLAGDNITLNYDDTLNSLTINSTASAGVSSAVTDLMISSGVVTIDLSLGTFFVLDMTNDVNNVVFVNEPAAGFGASFNLLVKQHASSLKNLFGFPSAVKWEYENYYVTADLGGMDQLQFNYYDSSQTVGRFGRVISGIYYLNELGVAPQCVFSIYKKLISTATNAIRVRRSSDNAEQDIGFTGNSLNTAALATFGGSDSVYLVKCYDQTGNGNDGTPSSNSKQPMLVNSGTYLGKMVFDGSDDTIVVPSLPNTGNYCAVYSRVKQNIGAAKVVFESSSNYNTNNGTFVMYANTSDYGVGMNDTTSSTQRSTAFGLGLSSIKLLSLLWDRTFTNIDEIKAWVDGSSLSPTAIGTYNQAGQFNTQTLYIGSRGDSSFFSDMEMDTFVFYNADTAAIRASIETLLT